MTEGSGVIPDVEGIDAVELRFELGQPDWSDAFHGRAKVPRRVKARLRGFLAPLLFVAAMLLLTDEVLAAGFALFGALLGLLFRRGVLAARQAKAGAPLGPWTVTVTDSGDGVRFAGTDLEIRRGWGSLGGYVETEDGFVLLGPAPHMLVVLYLPKRAVPAQGGIGLLREILDRHLRRYGRSAPQH